MKHLALALLAGCTTLGPMPSTTAVSAIPAGRPGVEATGAAVPVFRLSSAARGTEPDAERSGGAVGQLAAIAEPDRLLELKGVIVGGRVFGEGGDTGVEPIVGYRRQLDRLALAGVGYGTRMQATSNGANYTATRIGAEAIADLELLRLADWASLHVAGAVQATYLAASGRYCVNASGNGIDCAEDGSSSIVDGELEGVYPAVTVTASLDFARRSRSTFHSARLGGMISAGHMPRLVDGRQQWGDQYISGGISLTLGFGAEE